jgi:ketosteroid isomerase-like protein
MGDRRAEMTRRSYTAFSRLDHEAVHAVWHPDCTWEMGPWSLFVPESVWRGHEGLSRFIEICRRDFQSFEASIVEARSDDEVVLVRGNVKVVMRTVPEPLESRFGQVITFRDGLLHGVVQTDDPPPGWADAEPID